MWSNGFLARQKGWGRRARPARDVFAVLRLTRVSSCEWHHKMAIVQAKDFFCKKKITPLFLLWLWKWHFFKAHQNSLKSLFSWKKILLKDSHFFLSEENPFSGFYVELVCAGVTTLLSPAFINHYLWHEKLPTTDLTYCLWFMPETIFLYSILLFFLLTETVLLLRVEESKVW